MALFILCNLSTLIVHCHSGSCQTPERLRESSRAKRKASYAPDLVIPDGFWHDIRHISPFSKMTDDVFQRVLKLTNDLAVQQQSNQALASGIKSQLVELKVLSLLSFRMAFEC